MPNDNPCEKHLNVRASGYCPICLIEEHDRLRAEKDLAAALAVDEAAKCRDSVPVLPDAMPDEMYAALQGDKDLCAEALRLVVRQTLDEYEQAIRSHSLAISESVKRTMEEARAYRTLTDERFELTPEMKSTARWYANIFECARENFENAFLGMLRDYHAASGRYENRPARWQSCCGQSEGS